MARAFGSVDLTTEGASAPWTHVATVSSTPNVAGDRAYRDGVADITANVRVRAPGGTPIGTVIALAGGGGGGAFSTLSNADTNVCTPAIAAGWTVVEIGWVDPPALSNTGGVFSGTQGPLALLSRAAALFDAIYNDATIHDAGNVPFVLLGQSGGSAQIAYALCHYGLGAIVDMAIMCSGPPHARLDFGIYGTAHDYWGALAASYRMNAGGFTNWSAAGALFVDYSYGSDQTGSNGITPVTHKTLDGGADNKAVRDSILNVTAERAFPSTDLRFIFSDGDESEATTFGRWFSDHVDGKSLDVTIISGVEHVDVPGSASGSAAILAALAELE